ncbi:zinc fingers and homeoboxes protein 3 isoform X2 [Stigmatopora argus]
MYRRSLFFHFLLFLPPTCASALLTHPLVRSLASTRTHSLARAQEDEYIQGSPAALKVGPASRGSSIIIIKSHEAASPPWLIHDTPVRPLALRSHRTGQSSPPITFPWSPATSAAMASKRKSSVPCMIPSKSKHAREEIILGSLPELLPTIPEDGILSISGDERGGNGGASEVQKGGAYACPPCSFESRDLNYFLDHMHTCHADFRAQGTFYCLSCAVSVVRFEALALHNAKTHPKIVEGSMTASLSVNRRDGITAVEQSLFTDGGGRDGAISLSKTPIAKMMRAKGEHKKIVVSHTVEVLKKAAAGRDADPAGAPTAAGGVPELQNGATPRTAAGGRAPPPPPTSNRVFRQHQHAPPSPYSPCHKDLPKVMIPLSSIPTYDAAMDTSSFLKTSFGKFPYPTKAELCYLTVVSEFPEEQIKLWFTAQRLKQGISWSPEEIEEARRKMFNTVFQGAAPQKQAAGAQRHVNHIVTHRTVTAPSGSKGPNFPVADAPFGAGTSRAMGVLAKQASASTNPHVTRVSYSTPILSQKLPSSDRHTQAPVKNLQAEAEKCGDGLAAAAVVYPANENVARQSADDGGGPSNGVHANISNNDLHYVATPNDPSRDIFPSGPESSDHDGAAENTSDINHNNHNSVLIRPQEHADTSRKKPRDDTPPPNHAGSPSPAESTTSSSSGGGANANAAAVITKSSPSALEMGVKSMSILQQLIKEDDPFAADGSGADRKMEPVKINFKRLKVNEGDGASESARHEGKAERGEGSFSPPWAAKNAQQLRILRQAFSGARWPNSQQYEDLSRRTGLPKSEVVRWFSDSRHSSKNGQLKWLETYLRPAPDADEAPAPARWRPDPPPPPPPPPLTADKRWLRDAEGEREANSEPPLPWQDLTSPLRGLMASGASGELVKSGSSPKDAWPERERQQLTASQPLIEQPNDANQTRLDFPGAAALLALGTFRRDGVFT